MFSIMNEKLQLCPKKAKLKKSDGRMNLDKYRVLICNIAKYHFEIWAKLISKWAVKKQVKILTKNQHFWNERIRFLEYNKYLFIYQNIQNIKHNFHNI